MKEAEKKYRSLPFWSWNDKLDKEKLIKQIEWMDENGIGGFFMHARGGLKTEYLSEEWFDCVDACAKRAEELDMEAYAYDENGWPSGFVGGKLLEDVENRDMYLTYTCGEYDKNALASYDISGDRLIRVFSPCKECLNVYSHYSTSTADILNPEVVQKFLDLTHEEYKKRDRHGIKGFFTDEPQYQRWGHPYTRVLPEYFLNTYGEDILDRLGLMFVEKEGYRDFRYKYWKSMQSLMLNAFGKMTYEWCDKNGYKLTGHYIEENCLCGQMECCGGIMPFYEYEHIPGIDYLGGWIGSEIAPKQVSSVASQLGKEQVITETYGCCGWDINPSELKKVAECQYVSGVNLMCQHLLPYSEYGQRKRDYPAHYSEINPWVRKAFKEFNGYFSYLGKLLAQSKEPVSVGVLHPIRSAYFDYKFSPSENWHGLGDILEKPFERLTNELCYKGIPHHYIDETLLEKYGKTENGVIFLGKCAYKYLILPEIFTMDKSTEAILKKFVSDGGRVLLYGNKPEYLEGIPYSYDYLVSNITLDEIIADQPYTVSENSSVRTVYRTDKDGKSFIYAVNLGEKTEVTFTVKGGTSFDSYDILRDEYKTIPLTVPFESGQSYILYISDKKCDTPPLLSPLHLGNEFTLCHKVDNYFTLDMIRYSRDGGITYSEPIHHMGILDILLKERYEGKLLLKYEFTVDKLPEKCVLLAEEERTSVKINDTEAAKIGTWEYESNFYRYDIAKKLRVGKNEIVIALDYYQSENVYYALFGENVTESLKNCLVYDTNIEPVYLMGDFGIYGEFTRGKRDDILLGNNFRMGEQKTVISSLIEDGFPFFSGDITLKQTLTVTDTAMELVTDKRFHLIDASVNGKYMGRMMFDSELDISRGLKVGENEIELTLTVGNRNLFGPFHTVWEEPGFVGPDTFERFGHWDNGKNKYLTDFYAFIKTII
ncbi:MAG: hypothetical protein IJW19_00270 [Clostridia bacterium]|nr:hypothetical protein [Clostridia bacterium]